METATLLPRLLDYSGILLHGAVTTISITIGAFIIAIVLGLVGAILKQSSWAACRAVVGVFVEVFRDIPPLTLLFIMYFGLSYVGLQLSPMTTAIVGLGLNGAAYCIEIFRSGFSALHHGQREAAATIGMTPSASMRYIILPQAIRIVLPPLGNYAVGLLKDTAVASAVAAPEILFRARNLTTESYEAPLIYLLVAVIYFCMAFPISRWVARLERTKRAWS